MLSPKKPTKSHPLTPQACSRDFLWGEGGGVCAYIKNQDQIVNVGMIGHASSKDTRVLGERGPGHAPLEKFWNLRTPNYRKSEIKLSILPSPHYFISFQIFYNLIRWTFLVPGRCMHTPPPAYRACILSFAWHDTDQIRILISVPGMATPTGIILYV